MRRRHLPEQRLGCGNVCAKLDGTMDIYKPEHEIPDGIFIMDQTR